MSVSCKRYELSSRGLCNKLITRPEVVPTVMRRCVWSRNLKNAAATARVGSQPHNNRNNVTETNGSYLDDRQVSKSR
jgi:hypothetical protein